MKYKTRPRLSGGLFSLQKFLLSNHNQDRHPLGAVFFFGYFFDFFYFESQKSRLRANHLLEHFIYI